MVTHHHIKRGEAVSPRQRLQTFAAISLFLFCKMITISQSCDIWWFLRMRVLYQYIWCAVTRPVYLFAINISFDRNYIRFVFVNGWFAVTLPALFSNNNEVWTIDTPTYWDMYSSSGVWSTSRPRVVLVVLSKCCTVVGSMCRVVPRYALQWEVDRVGGCVSSVLYLWSPGTYRAYQEWRYWL